MLRMNTMRAGDGGELLARTLNDLTLSLKPKRPDADGLELWDASAGLSPTRGLDVQDLKWRVQIRDASGRPIAERTFPRSMTPDIFADVVRQITGAVERINRRRRNPPVSTAQLRGLKPPFAPNWSIPVERSFVVRRGSPGKPTAGS